MRLPTAPVVAAGLIGGYAIARTTGNRPLGGLFLAAAGGHAINDWRKNLSPATTGALTATYIGAFVASHPLAKKVGAWPSVALVSAAASAITYAVADRK